MKTPDLILYADDDLDDREMLEQAFPGSSGKRFLTFPTGDELIEFLLRHRDEVCAIVLDVNMPPKTGIQTLCEIRRQPGFRDLPAIIYTTASSPIAMKEIEALQALTLTKPVSFKGMEEIAQKILDYCAPLA